MFDESPSASVLAALLAHLQQADYQFTTVTPASHARVLRRSNHGETLRDAFGWTRTCPSNLVPQALLEDLIRHNIVSTEGHGWRSRVRASTLGDLLLLHSAYPTLDADSVFFGPDTYRFVASIRRWMQQNEPAARVADIGCGSGAAGLTIARAWPEAHVTLIDINDRALEFARINARHAKMSNVEIVNSNLFNAVSGRFDLVVANPPYMADPLRRNYRDGGGKHGCDLSARILEQSIERLNPGGTLLLYTGTPVVDGSNIFFREAETLLRNVAGDWTFEELDPDVFGEELDTDAYAEADRIAAVLLTFRKATP